MNRIIAALCCCLLISAAAVTVTATTQSSYSVTVPGSMETPEQTATVEGSTYTIDSIARADEESLTVQTDGPSGESYRIHIHANNDGSRAIYDTKYVPGDGNGEISLNISAFEAGSYMISIYHDGTYYSPQPLVVPAYSTTVTGPETAQPTGTTELTASLSELRTGASIHNVEIVVYRNGTVQRLETTKEGDSYVSELDLESLETGEYQYYAIIYSSEDAPRGENEVIGISDGATLTIQTASETTTTAPSSGGGGSQPTESPTTQATTQSQPTTQAPTTTSPPTTATTDEPTKTTPEPTTTDASVITPSTGTTSTTDSEGSGTGTSVPGFGVSAALVAALAAVVLAMRRE